ncbi:MAG TPA: MG2 domain-containing protein, partial [Agriterribacter sp.]|nr:MG2 domain-containing protein [Agriterribacter sp.]
MAFLKHVILYTLSIFLFMYAKGQTKMNTYDSAWKKVDQLLNKKGLTKSAATEVQKIYNKAKKEKNDAQLIKAVIYQLNLEQLTAADDEPEHIQKIEAEINESSKPVTQILQSIAAEMYWNYFRDNRWKLYGRTNTAGFNKQDIATWTMDDLHAKISELYLASLQDEKLLQETKLENYDAIIVKGNTRTLRPTLYDLLANRALDYFENDERDITKPAYAFNMTENAAFDPVSDFIHRKFITKDTAALHYKALLIHQQLLSFHHNDPTYDALIDADLRRLQFVYRQAVMPQKEEVYQMALKHITAQYEKQPAASQAWYLLAQYYYNKGNIYDDTKGNEQDKYAYKSAKEICERAIKDFPKTEGAANCQNLLNSILRKSLALQTEKINIPGEAFRTLVNYKNCFSVHFRIIAVDKNVKAQLQNRNSEAYWSRLSDIPALKQWTQELPGTEDYRNHSVEIKVDALPVGEYALLASINDDFNVNGNLLAAQYFYVSNISFINNETDYFALHRNSGQPLANASVQVWTSAYDYSDRKNKLQKAELLSADKNGFFTIQKPGKENHNIKLEINWQKDHLFMDEYQYLYNRYDPYAIADDEDFEQKNSRVYFFTDRSIYRPGQTVYFKGIGITKNKETRKATIITGKQVEVYLNDENDQVVDSIILTLNEYGSIHGQFRLPQNVLTGNFNITAEDYEQSTAYFSVEEYKRPKFSVELDQPKESFAVNDTVSIPGFAKAYAGNVIDGATVVYRVTRQARFIYPWLYYKRGMPRTSSMEITNGTTTTDTNGKFSISFTAIPDLTLDKNLDPVFDYTVQVDVTDINGETRSNTTIIPVGYKSLVLDINLPQSPMPVDSFTILDLSSKNLSGEWQAVKATVSIYPLQTPQRLIRSRYWEEPDQFIYSEAEFIQFFPHDEYKDESDHHNWKKEKAIYTDTFTTQPNFKFKISNLPAGKAGLKFPQGWYTIEATAKDKDGGEVKTVAYIQLYDADAKTIPAPAYEWEAVAKTNLEPGETAHILTGTSAADIFVIQQIDKQTEDQPVPRPIKNSTTPNNENSSYHFFTLNSEKKNFNFPITENERGGFGVAHFFVKDNRFYGSNQIISVPWRNKELNISFSTFRDKVEPGSEEKWQVKVSGNKGEKLAAEMLASMYDASLDQFKPHNWPLPAIWPQYYSSTYWSGRQSFVEVQSQERNAMPEKNISYEKRYDMLINPGVATLNDVVVTGYGIQKRAVAMAAAPPQAEMEGDLQEKRSFSFVAKAEGIAIEEVAPKPAPSPITRKNFNETAFFFPGLTTDSAGNISVSFTMPEALTQWKLMTLAHTKELAMGYAQQFTVTQKELMVQPN